MIQRTCLTPLPGARLFKRLQEEGRLLYTDFPKDWDRYDMTEVVHRPLWMEPRRLADMLSERARRLYNRGFLWRRFFRTWLATRSFTTAMWAYLINLNYRTVILSRLLPPENVPPPAGR